MGIQIALPPEVHSTGLLELWVAIKGCNLPGWRWATITKVALDRLSRSLHSDVCDSDGLRDAAIHSTISGSGGRRDRATSNILQLYIVPHMQSSEGQPGGVSTHSRLFEAYPSTVAILAQGTHRGDALCAALFFGWSPLLQPALPFSGFSDGQADSREAHAGP